MPARAARLVALLAALAAAAPAHAQWETRPVVVWLDGPARDVLPGTFQPAAPGPDLLVVDQAGRTASLRPHHAPLSVAPSAFPAASFPLERAFRAGSLAVSGAPDALADVASHYATGGLGTPPSRVDVVFGHDPSIVHGFALPLPTSYHGPSEGDPPYVPSFLRLLARTPAADTIVLPYCFEATCSRVFLVDPVTVSSAVVTSFAAPVLTSTRSQPEAFPVWLSAVARANGLDDVAAGSYGTVVVWAQEAVATGLGGLDLSDAIVIGTTQSFTYAGLPLSYVQGVASADVDAQPDGVPDLVFAMADPLSSRKGTLVAVKGTGIPADLADPAKAPWEDLGARLGLPDPVVVRPLRGSGTTPPSVAVWDRTLQELTVVTPVPAERRLAVWSAPAPGTWARDIRLADVVSGAAPDLVVVMESGAAATSVLVFPDPGGPWPALAWAPGSPGTPARGVPHAMAVVLDPGGAASVEVDWIAGAATAAPVGTGLAHVFAATCAADPPPLAVTVRAISETGTTSPDLSASLAYARLAPALVLAGAPRGALVLPPGGTSATFEAAVATSCGAASFGGTAWPAAATIADSAGPSWIRRTVSLPEAAYPALLAEPAPVVSVSTTDPGVTPSSASLVVPLDASGLADLREEADRTTLEPGDLAVLRIHVRSRLGVALPLVSVAAALAGLEPAGAPRLTGADLVATGRGGAELVLSALPPAGTEVVVELPVRAVASRGGAGAEARSSGGWALTAPAAVATGSAARAGCGCGTGSGPGAAALALAALALRRRPRRAT